MKPIYVHAAVAAGAFLGVFLLFSANTHAPQQKLNISGVYIGEKLIRVEVADTLEERTEGLSGRTGLAADEGMLFIFPEDGLHAFWMKDMLFPIDIVWLSNDRVVTDIAPSVSPSTYPASFSPTTPVRYALELPAGLVEEYAIEKGDTFLFK